MQREIIKWLQCLDLSVTIRNPRRDMANGVAAAEIISIYCTRNRYLAPPTAGSNALTQRPGGAHQGEDADDDREEAAQRVLLNPRAIDPSATSAGAKRANWVECLRVLGLLRCTTVTPALAEAVVHLHPNAAQVVLENLYEFFTQRKLAMRSADAVVDTTTQGTATSMGKERHGTDAKKPAARGLGAAAAGQYYASPEDIAAAASLLEVAGELTEPELPSGGAPWDPATGGTRTAASTNRSHRSDTLKYFAASQGSTKVAAVTSTNRIHHNTTTYDPFFTEGATEDPERQARAQLQEELFPEAVLEVQAKLALTRNEELAAGPRALEAQGKAHYLRPTASSLVHTASNTRHDISLVKPKYAEDERTAQLRNERLLAQHAAVERAYFREPDPSAAVAAVLASTTKKSGARTATPTDATTKPPTLTEILRGPFAANVSLRRGQTRSATGVKKEKRVSDTDTQRAAERRADEKVGTTKGGSSPLSSAQTRRGRGGAMSATSSSGTGGPRHIQVNILPDSLRAALEVNGVFLHGDERAGEKSVQVFRECHWRLQAGLSQVLKDVLQARRDLTALLDLSRRTSVVFRSDEVVLQDLLSCVVAHRQELSPDTVAACWDALEQNVPGIAASILHRPSEYEYLLQTFGDAFAAKAARVRLLHVSASGSSPSNDGTDNNDGERVMATGGRRQSVGVALLTAARRRPSYAAAALQQSFHDDTLTDQTLDPASGSSVDGAEDLPQQAVFKDKEAREVCRVFVFLRSIGRAMQEQHRHETPSSSPARDSEMEAAPLDCKDVPLHVMNQFLLPAAQRFILPTGTPASVEAVARVLVATLYPTHPSLDAVQSATQILEILENKLRPQLDKQFAHSGSAGHAPERSRERFALVAYHVLSQLLEAQRMTQREISLDAVPGLDNVTGAREAHTSAVAVVKDFAMGLAQECVTTSSGPESTLRALSLALLLVLAPTEPLQVSVRTPPPNEDAPELGPSYLDVVLSQLNTCAAVGVPSTEGRTVDSTSTWEARALALELALVVAYRLVAILQPKRHPESVRTEEDTDGSEDEGKVRHAVNTFEELASSLLGTFADANSGSRVMQQQLALSVVSRRLMPEVFPRLCERWLGMLLALPADALTRSLLPHETQPLALRMEATSDAATVNVGSPLASSIGVLPGRVEACYVVAPLNQQWNTSGVVQLVLRNLHTMDPDTILSIVAAALISPQPVTLQETELLRNMQLADQAVPTFGKDKGLTDSSRDDAGGCNSTDGDEGEGEEAFACTLRDVVTVGQPSDRPLAHVSPEQDSHSVGEDTPSEAAAEGVSTVAFWRGVLHRLAPVLVSALRPATMAPHASHSYDTEGREEDYQTDTQETAMAVLFTAFRKCATPEEVAEVNARRARGMDAVASLVEWMVGGA